MKKGSPIAKRAVALVMAVIMTVSTVNLAWAAPGGAAEPTMTAGELLGAVYGTQLSAKEKALLESGYLTEETYTYTAPDTANGDGKVSIDAGTKVVTATDYTDGGFTWKPVSAKVMVAGAGVEDVTLTDGVGTFAYTGTSYSIAVTYKMYITLATATQLKMMSAAGDLLEAAAAVKKAADGVATLEDLLNTGIQCNLDDMMQNINNPGAQAQQPLYKILHQLNTAGGGGIPLGATGMSLSVFGSGSAEDIAAGTKLEALVSDFQADGKLNVGSTLAAYLNSSSLKNAAALCAAGSGVCSAVTTAYEQIELIRQTITTLENGYTMFGKPVPADVQAAFGLGNVVLTNIENDLTPCKDYDWSKLTGLVKSDLTAAQSAGLDTMVNALTAGDITHTAPAGAQLLADTTVVTASVAQGTINVVIKAAVYGKDATVTTALSQNAGTLRMAAGTSQADLTTAVDGDASMETAVLSTWNMPAADGHTYDIDTTHYTRTVAVSPAITSAGLADATTYTYTITYTPKQYQVTAAGCSDITEGLYDYGYCLTLPVLVNAEKVYDYTVNGASRDQGEKVRIVGAATITRVEGKAWEKHNVGEMILGNYADGDTVAQGILPSAALSTGSVRLRTPDAAANLLSISADGGSSYTVTAKPYSANTAGLVWVPDQAVCVSGGAQVGTPTDFAPSGANYKATVSGSFDSVTVTYKLQLGWTDIAADFDADKALVILNLPYTLAGDAARQMSAMSTLSGQYSTLGEVGGKMNLIRSTIKGDDNVQQATKNTVDTLYNTCYNADAKQLVIYDYITQYRACTTDGAKLAYYYNNWAVMHAQVQTIYDSLTVVVNDPAVETLIKDTPETADYYDKIDEVTTKFGQLLADMVEPSAFLNKASVQLTTLSAAIAAARGNATQYTAASVAAAPYLTTALSVDAPNKLTVTINVTVQSSDGETTKTGSRSVTFDADDGSDARVLQAADITQLSGALSAAKTAAEVDETHYVLTDDSAAMLTAGTTLSAAKTLQYTYVPESYTVKYTEDGSPVSGLNDVTIRYDNRTVNLPACGESGFRYDYTVNGVKMSTASYTFTAAEIDSLFASGSYTIDRTKVDIGRENILLMVDKLNQAAVDRGFTYVENGKVCLKVSFVPVEKNGALSIVLRVSPTGLTEEMVNLLADLVQELMTFSNVTIGGETFYDGEKLYLQSMVNMLLHSGFGMDTILGAIDSTGDVNEMTDLNGCTYPTAVGGVIVVDGNKYAAHLEMLGAKMLKTDLTLGGSAAALYITLEDFNKSAEELLDVRNGVDSARSYVNAALSGGAIHVDVTAPDSVYQVLLTALLVLGENDLDDIAGFSLKDAETRLFEIIKPVLLDETVTGATIQNTLTKMGVTADVSKYTGFYDKNIGTIRRIINAATFNKADGSPANEKMSANVSYSVNDLLSGVSDSLRNVLSGIISERNLTGALALSVTPHTEASAYQAMVISSGGVKLVENLGGYTVDKGPAVVVALRDVPAHALANTLRLTGDNVILDLHGRTLACNVVCTGSNDLIVDSTMATAASGAITGNISGAVITAGHYASDVTAMLKEGYSLSGGLVSNDLFTVETAGNAINVTLKAEMNTLTGMGTASLGAVAAEMASDILLSYYATAQSLSVDGNSIYTLSIDDATTLFSGGALSVSNAYGNTLMDQIFHCGGATALINDLIGKLTDFRALADAVGTGTPVVSYALDSTAWDVTLSKAAGGDYLMPGITDNAAAGTTGRTLNVYINSTSADDNANFKGVLQEMEKLIKTLDVTATLTDVSLPASLGGKTVTASISGDGEVYIDMSEDETYVIVTALVAAGKLPAGALRSEFATAIDKYYTLGDMSYLKTAMEKITLAQVITGLKSVTASTSFTAIAANLGLGAEAMAALNTANVDTGMKGYRDAMAVVGKMLNGLGISGNSGTLSGRDTGAGSVYGAYVFNQTNVNKSFSRTISSPWAVKADLTFSNVKVTLKMFNKDNDIVVKNTATGQYIYNDADLAAALAKINTVNASTIVFNGGSYSLSGNVDISKDVTVIVKDGAAFSLNGKKFVLTDKDAAITMAGIALTDAVKSSALQDAYNLVKTGDTVSLVHKAVGVVSAGVETYYDAIPAITGACTVKIYGDVVLSTDIDAAYAVTVTDAGGTLTGPVSGTGRFVLRQGGSLVNGFAVSGTPWTFRVITDDPAATYVDTAGNTATRKLRPLKVNDIYYMTWAEAVGHINESATNSMSVYVNTVGSPTDISKALDVTVAAGVSLTGVSFRLTDRDASVTAHNLTLSAANVTTDMAGFEVKIDTAANKAVLKESEIKVEYTEGGAAVTKYCHSVEAALTLAGGKACTITMLLPVTLSADVAVTASVSIQNADKLTLDGKKFVLSDKDASVTMSGIALTDATKSSALQSAYNLVKTGNTVALAHKAVGVVSSSGVETYYDSIPAITGACTVKIYGAVVLSSDIHVAYAVNISNDGGSLTGPASGTGRFVLKQGGSLVNGFAVGSGPWAFSVVTDDSTTTYVDTVGNTATRKLRPIKLNDVYYMTWADAVSHINDNASNSMTILVNTIGSTVEISKALDITVATGVSLTGAAFKLTDRNASVTAHNLTLSAGNVIAGVDGYEADIDTAANKAVLKKIEVFEVKVEYTDGSAVTKYCHSVEAALTLAGSKACTITVLLPIALGENVTIDSYVSIVGADKITCGEKKFSLTKTGSLFADVDSLGKAANVSTVLVRTDWWRYYNNEITNGAVDQNYAVYEANTNAYYKTIQEAVAAAAAAGVNANVTVVMPLAFGTAIEVESSMTLHRRSNITTAAGLSFKLTKADAVLGIDNITGVSVSSGVVGYTVIRSTIAGYSTYTLRYNGGGGGGVIIPDVPASGHVSGSYIYLDLQPSGVNAAKLQTAIRKVFGSSTATVSVNSGLTSAGLVANGASITVSNSGSDGTYTVIVMGDTNCNGKTDAGDAVKMRNHYFGTSTLSGVSLMAADMNRNGKVDAGDAVKNRVKYQGWSSYKSDLKVTV